MQHDLLKEYLGKTIGCKRMLQNGHPARLCGVFNATASWVAAACYRGLRHGGSDAAIFAALQPFLGATFTATGRLKLLCVGALQTSDSY